MAKIIFTLRSEVHRLFKEAKENIIIVTPYFDHFLVESLLQLTDRLSFINVSLITCYNRDYLENNPHQLNALIEIFKIGIKAFSYPTLHTKLLIIDDCKQVLLGSQNYTYRGEIINHEISSSLSENEIDNIKELKSQLEKLKNGSIEINFDDISNIEKKVSKKLKDQIIDNFELKYEFPVYYNIRARKDGNFDYYFSYQQYQWEVENFIRDDHLYMFPSIFKDKHFFLRLGNTSSSRIGSGVTFIDMDDIDSELFDYNIQSVELILDNESSEENLFLDFKDGNGALKGKVSFKYFHDEAILKSIRCENHFYNFLINKFTTEDGKFKKEYLGNFIKKFKYDKPIKATRPKLELVFGTYLDIKIKIELRMNKNGEKLLYFK